MMTEKREVSLGAYESTLRALEISQITETLDVDVTQDDAGTIVDGSVDLMPIVPESDLPTEITMSEALWEEHHKISEPITVETSTFRLKELKQECSDLEVAIEQLEILIHSEASYRTQLSLDLERHYDLFEIDKQAFLNCDEDDWTGLPKSVKAMTGSMDGVSQAKELCAIAVLKGRRLDYYRQDLINRLTNTRRDITFCVDAIQELEKFPKNFRR